MEGFLSSQLQSCSGTADRRGGESCTSVREVVTEVLDDRSSMISIKLARTGIVESLRIRDFCSAVGIGVIVGSQGESALGTFASVAFAAAVPSTVRFPSELGYFVELDGSICANDPIIENGRMRVPDVPGFGAEIDLARLEQYRYQTP